MDPIAFSFRVFVPEDSNTPVEFYDDVNAFRVAAVHKEHVGKLPPEWDVPAVYVLLGDRGSDGGWDAYAGKAPAGVKARLRQHVRSKEGWSRALIVVRDTTMGMNSAQIGWLEGRLHEMLCDEYSNVRMLNNVQPGDKTLMAHDYVESAVITVRSCLRVLGYQTSRTPQSRNPNRKKDINKKTPTIKEGSVLDLLKSGLLAPNCQIVSTSPKWTAQGKILPTGEVETSGQRFSTPSGAGVFVRGGLATNGWTFWAVKQPDGTLKTLAEYRSDYMSKFG